MKINKIREKIIGCKHWKKVDDFYAYELDKITSIYFQKGRRLCGYFDDLENVKCQEQLLKDYGWIKGNRPTINIKFENDSE